jgi:hypothetical protein
MIFVCAAQGGFRRKRTKGSQNHRSGTESPAKVPQFVFHPFLPHNSVVSQFEIRDIDSELWSRRSWQNTGSIYTASFASVYPFAL